ncbi:hypothetical protein NUJ28_06170 [Burkholderia multivorans]|uniref:hypothetical protein n=1 Tax=Burkholderia multivorans TaxID=87883 RepID=UPI002018624A|nr:hypothetical protein [Burkholderia multivorans]UQN71777.1 hypothetical protein L0Z45_26255 [Burkholderia multivorans]UQN77513.1 hypothetical protein L0Z11_26285 [Burkholderia multivorans]UXZ62300.1 hypothetical protein NUJ28_06170 [Burkholderia multivorans]
MIDQDKMRALAIKVGAVEWYEAGDSVSLPDGDTIACCQSSIGHMPEPIHYDDMVEYLVSVSPAKILKLIDAFEAAEREREQLRAELEAAAADKQENLTGDRLTDQKAAHIMQRDGYKLTGVVLCRDDGARCIVESSAVRWLTKDESWALMHPAALAQRQGEGS